MSESVKVLKLGVGEFAAEVHEGNETTQHRLVFSNEFRDDLQLSAPDDEKLITESMKYLLERIPVTSLPHDIDLEQVQQTYSDFTAELRARMTH